MTSVGFSTVFPPEPGQGGETWEDKGYVVVRVLAIEPRVEYEITFYEPHRLSQDIDAALHSPTAPHSLLSNIVVVERLTREEIGQAISALADNGFERLKPAEAEGHTH